MATLSSKSTLSSGPHKHTSTSTEPSPTETLDTLLEQYLVTLDAYQTAQRHLTSTLKFGFLSLAQANFANSTGTRYGQDYYDERMQVVRTVAVTEEGSRAKVAIKAATAEAPSQRVESAAKDSTESKPESINVAEDDSNAPTQESSKSPADAFIDPSSEKPELQATTAKSSRDPLHWFGILVPPALRSAQASFISAVEGPIPDVLALATELREQETAIGRLRKAIRKM